MNDSTPPWPRTVCEMTGCGRREAGHAVHRIQRGRVNGSPWQWRTGVVRSAEVGPEGHDVVVHYVEQDADVTVRHHLPLPLEPGDVVGLHEHGHLIEYADQWRSIEVVAGGLGIVQEPVDAAAWPRRREGTPDSVAAYMPG